MWKTCVAWRMRCRLIDLSPISYILFAKLAPFTPEEIALARTLNGEYQRRVILLTARELEPYYLYERTRKETGITAHEFHLTNWPP
jgi:hypothetical protein